MIAIIDAAKNNMKRKHFVLRVMVRQLAAQQVGPKEIVQEALSCLWWS